MLVVHLHAAENEQLLNLAASLSSPWSGTRAPSPSLGDELAWTQPSKDFQRLPLPISAELRALWGRSRGCPAHRRRRLPILSSWPGTRWVPVNAGE